MPELSLERRIHAWTDHATADTTPVGLDEILQRAATSVGDVDVDSNPEPDIVTIRPRPRRLLAVAATIALVAATIAAALTLLPDDDPPVADEGLKARLLSLATAETEAGGNTTTVVDVQAIREADGLSAPPADASDELVDEYHRALIDRRIHPAGSFPAGQREWEQWWGALGIDLSRVDGWISWGEGITDAQAVLIGDFDVTAIDTAVRNNQASDLLAVGEHRGAATYSWGEDDEFSDQLDGFPGPRPLHLAVIEDDIVALAHSTTRLHEIIDLHLDGGPSYGDYEDVQRVIDPLADEPAINLWRVDVRGLRLAWIAGAETVQPGPVRRRVFALPQGEPAAEFVAPLSADVVDVVDELMREYPREPLDEVGIALDPRDDVLVVEIEYGPVDVTPINGRDRLVVADLQARILDVVMNARPGDEPLGSGIERRP